MLPVPYAFSRMGVALGLLTALVVSAANAYTGTLLIRASGAANRHTFEALAQAVGGRGWRVATQARLVMGRVAGLLLPIGRRVPAHEA